MADGVILTPEYRDEVRARIESGRITEYDVISLDAIAARAAVTLHDAPRLLAAAEQMPVLIAEIKRLREALGVFANPRRWRYDYTWRFYGEQPYERAQKALDG